MWHKCGRGEVHTGFWWGNLTVRDNLEDKGIDEKIIFKWISRISWDSTDCTDLAQDRDKLW
jgi:hypothetical protein